MRAPRLQSSGPVCDGPLGGCRVVRRLPGLQRSRRPSLGSAATKRTRQSASDRSRVTRGNAGDRRDHFRQLHSGSNESSGCWHHSLTDRPRRCQIKKPSIWRGQVEQLWQFSARRLESLAEGDSCPGCEANARAIISLANQPCASLTSCPTERRPRQPPIYDWAHYSSLSTVAGCVRDGAGLFELHWCPCEHFLRGGARLTVLFARAACTIEAAGSPGQVVNWPSTMNKPFTRDIVERA